MKTSSILSGASLARSSAAPMTWERSLWALNGDSSPMKRPSGVRAAERMTTGSEVAAMAVSLESRRNLLHDEYHMMHCENCNARSHDKMSSSDEPCFSASG